MEFRYREFGENIFEQLFFEQKASQNTIFIFADDMDKNRGIEWFSKYMQFSNCQITTFSEFKELLFFSHFPLLREEKRVIGFYKSLDRESREFFRVSEYFDTIDIAANFFSLFSELNEAVIGDLGSIVELRKQQKEMYQMFKKIYLNYSSFLEKNGFTDTVVLHKKENIDYRNLNGIEKLIFINPMSFSKLEREIIRGAEKLCQTLFYVYGSEECYGEELVSKEFELKCRHGSYALFKDEFTQCAAFLEIAENSDKIEVVDAKQEGLVSRMFYGEGVARSRKAKFTDTPLFVFISFLYEMAVTRECVESGSVIKSSIFLEAVGMREFCSYFGIDDICRKEIMGIILGGNCYLDNSHRAVARVIQEVEKIHQCKTVAEMSSYLNSLELSFFETDIYPDCREVFYSSIYEMNSIDTLGILTEEDGELFFGRNRGVNLLRVAIKFLRYDEVSLGTAVSEEKRVIFRELQQLPSHREKEEKSFFLNLSEGAVPQKKKNSFFFTEQQKKECGIIGYEEERADSKRKFAERINCCSEPYFFAIENEEKNIEISSFLEELIENGSLREVKIESSYKNEIAKFYGSGINSCRTKPIEAESEKIEKGSSVSLKTGYYDFSTLMNCPAKYYFSKKAGIDKNYPEIRYSADLMLIGVIVHDIFREAAEEIRESGKAEIDINEALRKIKARFRKNQLKFPIPFRNYYEEVAAPFVAKSLSAFFSRKEIKEYMENSKIHIEESFKYEESERGIVLSAKPDMMIEKNGTRVVIDYKTGGGSMEQLNFYGGIIERQLGKAAEETVNIIYYVFKESVEAKTAREEYWDKVEDEIERYIKEESYERTEKRALCAVCIYYDICRPERCVNGI